MMARSPHPSQAVTIYKSKETSTLNTIHIQYLQILCKLKTSLKNQNTFYSKVEKTKSVVIHCDYNGPRKGGSESELKAISETSEQYCK